MWKQCLDHQIRKISVYAWKLLRRISFYNKCLLHDIFVVTVEALILLLVISIVHRGCDGDVRISYESSCRMTASSCASLLKMWTDWLTKNLNHNMPEIIFFFSGPKYLEIGRISERVHFPL